VYEWLKQGYTDYSIADQLGISQISWIRYKDKYDKLASLYARARKERNTLVMNKQLESAIGYEHKDLFIAQYQGQIIEKEIIKYYPPNVQAAELYLRNNDPEYKTAKESVNVAVITNAQPLDPISSIEDMARLEARKTAQITGQPEDDLYNSYLDYYRSKYQFKSPERAAIAASYRVIEQD